MTDAQDSEDGAGPSASKTLSDATPAIEVRALVTRLGTQIVHQDLDLTVRSGEIVGLVGASGSGKSILLRALLGLLRPERGAIRIFGTEITTASEAEKQNLKSMWGVVFQENALFSGWTVRENIEIALRQCINLSADLMWQLAEIKIAMAKLPPEVGDQFPSELSGGMRKRAALARALATDPRLLLLDEPTAGLDPVVAAQLDSLILSLRDMLGVSVLFITHDLDSMHRVCDRIAVLADKRIVATGTPEQLSECDHEFVRAYFRNPRAAAAAASASRFRKTSNVSNRTHQTN
ncbi:MAG: ATP-binding cassette domain-containing protein [Rhizomicrobium sp.]